MSHRADRIDGRLDANGVDGEESDVDSYVGVVKEEDSDELPRTNGALSLQRSPTPASDDLPIRKFKSRSESQSPIKKESSLGTLTPASGIEESAGGDISLKMEPGKAPKLTRNKSDKFVPRPAPLFLDEEDKTAEAAAKYTVISDCEYANKWIGSTDDDLDIDEIECECEEDWDPSTRSNNACGEDSDCINRATKIECIGDCGCGPRCQNRRFQLKQYAKVSVFQTEKKGYGLRADTDLRPGDFIYEYVGEVIGDAVFERKRVQYHREKIKHFYFMSLSRGEYIDATKKGNVGRFCNHSCNPNCYVDKWVVKDKLRMGIFAMRHVKRGEELTFDYNVDRYGADPQPCYCGEPNCIGFLGGKTQTEAGTKLAHDTVEALGIEDGDDWDTAVAKKPRKRKTGEADEEFVANIKPKELEEDTVAKVMSQLMQKKEKWIVVKLLQRIQNATAEAVFSRVVKMHGYRIFRSILSSFQDDANVCLQVLDVLFKLPRITRNKIHDSKIEPVVEGLKKQQDERVMQQATEILEVWSKLEMGYRIPRVKRDPNDVNGGTPARTDTIDFDDRRARQAKRERSESRSPSPRRKAPTAPSGPRNNVPQRQAPFRSSFAPRPPPRPTLPEGWTEFLDKASGRPYFHSVDGKTVWERPTQPANIPPPPPKPISERERLQQIIDECVNMSSKASPTSTPQPTSDKSEKPDKSTGDWGAWGSEKRKKHYKNLIAPLAANAAGKHKDVIPKDRLKNYIKEITDQITNRHFEKGIAKYSNELPRDVRKKTEHTMKEYFDKARKKFLAHQNHAKGGGGGKDMIVSPDTPADVATPENADDDSIMTPVAPPPPPPPPEDTELSDRRNGSTINSSDNTVTSHTPPHSPPTEMEGVVHQDENGPKLQIAAGDSKELGSALRSTVRMETDRDDEINSDKMDVDEKKSLSLASPVQLATPSTNEYNGTGSKQ